jgi:hypothetical protein
MEEPVIEQKPGVKLFRSAKGFYHWEIKRTDLCVEELIRTDEEIRNQLKAKGLRFDNGQE